MTWEAWTTVSKSGFLASEVQCPAFVDPRTFLQAGDIETNPGPACDTCANEFSSRMNPLTCGADQCDRQCHRQEKCSGINRYANRTWRCHEHSAGTQLIAVCDECGRNLRGSTEKSARRCAVKDCPSLCHRGQKCSRISKYCRDGVWKCLAHSSRRRQPRIPIHATGHTAVC